MQNKYNDSPQQAGVRSEAKTSDRLSAIQTRGSGNQVHAKSDLILGNWRGESKATEKNSISLRLGWLRKIMSEAIAQAQRPFLTITFTVNNGDPRPGGTWVLIREQDFKALQEAARYDDEEIDKL